MSYIYRAGKCHTYRAGKCYTHIYIEQVNVAHIYTHKQAIVQCIHTDRHIQ